MPNPIQIRYQDQSKWHTPVWVIENKKTGTVATVTKQAGRLISLKVEDRELLVSRPEVFAKIPELLQRPRNQVSWLDINCGGPGGECTWVAPQTSWGQGQVPYLELNLGEYQAIKDRLGVSLISKPCEETGLQIFRSINFSVLDLKTLVVQSWIVNTSQQAREIAAWSVLQTKPNQVTIGCLAEKPYALEGSLPLEIAQQAADRSLSLSLDQATQSFKVGFWVQGPLANMHALYSGPKPDQRIVLHQTTRLSIAPGEARYPHHGPLEIYSSTDYTELEVLGPLQKVGNKEHTPRLSLSLTPRIINRA